MVEYDYHGSLKTVEYHYHGSLKTVDRTRKTKRPVRVRCLWGGMNRGAGTKRGFGTRSILCCHVIQSELSTSPLCQDTLGTPAILPKTFIHPLLPPSYPAHACVGLILHTDRRQVTALFTSVAIVQQLPGAYLRAIVAKKPKAMAFRRAVPSVTN